MDDLARVMASNGIEESAHGELKGVEDDGHLEPQGQTNVKSKKKSCRQISRAETIHGGRKKKRLSIARESPLVLPEGAAKPETGRDRVGTSRTNCEGQAGQFSFVQVPPQVVDLPLFASEYPIVATGDGGRGRGREG
jgi:hypothetical protein